MRKKKLILETIGKAVEKHGFVYDEERSIDGRLWMFVREQNLIVQRFYVQEYSFAKELILRFETSAWGTPTSDANELIPANERRNYLVFWVYKDETTFHSVLEEFIDIIEKYGIDKLNEMSIEEKVIPTNEMGRQLLEFHEELSLFFIENHQLEVEKRTPQDVLKWFEVVEEIMKQTKENPYEMVQGQLTEIAAFLGEQLRKEVGGEWTRGNDARNVFLDDLNCYGRSGYLIFRYVIEAWKKQSIERLKQEYLFMLDSKLPMEIEEMEALQKRWIEISKIE